MAKRNSFRGTVSSTFGAIGALAGSVEAAGIALEKGFLAVDQVATAQLHVASGYSEVTRLRSAAKLHKQKTKLMEKYATLNLEWPEEADQATKAPKRPQRTQRAQRAQQTKAA